MDERRWSRAIGDMQLLFSGDNYLAIRKGTIAAGF